MREERKWTNTIITSLVVAVLIYLLSPPIVTVGLLKCLPLSAFKKVEPTISIWVYPAYRLSEHCPPYAWIWRKELEFLLRK